MSRKITDFFASKNKNSFKKVQPIDVYTLMFDGGSRGNPGTAGAGFVIYKDMREIYSGCAPLGHATNNYAEYKGLELGLTCAIKKGIESLIIKGDSLLVLNQITNKWKVKSFSLKEQYTNVKKLLNQLRSYTVEHVKRKYNKRADELANMAMDGTILID